MAGIAIHDLDGPSLALDLEHILEAIGASGTDAEWRIRADAFSYVADDDEPVLEGERGQWVPGAAFKEAAARIDQVIDGVFEARQRPDGPLWVTVRAVDSSWWEVYTTDAEVLGSLRKRFSDVRPAQYEASTVLE